MKTVMKKLFSLMLVAVLLVSAVPFGASAAETTEAYDLTLTAGQTYSVDTILAENDSTTTSTNYWVHRTAPTAEDYVKGASFEAVEGGTYTLYVVETIIETEPTETEPTETEPTETEPQVTNVTCNVCGHVYSSGENHDCKYAICSDCKQTYEKAKGHTNCPVPADPVIRRVTFVADRVDRDKIFWEVNVQDGKTVYYPGITPDSDWDCLNKVGDYEDYTFMGWSTNRNATSGDTTATVVRQTISGGDRTYYAIYKNVAVDPPTSSRPGNITNKDNSNKVYLHIYLNGNAATEVHSTDLMELYLMDDDKVSNAEVLRFVSDYYYTAKDSNGMEIDGLYVNTGDKGTFPQMYYTDNKVDELTGINAMRDNGHVHISVMIKNAMRKDAVKNNYTADSSNPKTGDTIMAPVAVMGLSVSALAILFYLNKKRAF